MKIPFLSKLHAQLKADAAKARADKAAADEKAIEEIKQRLLAAIEIYTAVGFKSVGLHVWASDGSYAYVHVLAPAGTVYKLTTFPKGAHVLNSV